MWTSDFEDVYELQAYVILKLNENDLKQAYFLKSDNHEKEVM